MNPKLLTYPLITLLIIVIGCTEHASESPNGLQSQSNNFEQEKAAILKVINEETKAAFSRDYQAWQEHWIQEAYVSKTYINFSDTTLTETLGWKQIDDFVRTYIEAHPEPAPLPTLVDSIDVRLYGDGAWVNYVQNDPKLGLKREARLMEKENGQWKIAGMQTIIYGFRAEE